MNSWVLLLVLFGLWPLLKRYLVARNISAFRFCRKQVELAQESDLPSHFVVLSRSVRQELESMGFEFQGCNRYQAGIVPDENRWSLIYLHPGTGCYAVVEMSDEVTRIGTPEIDLMTMFSDETVLLTTCRSKPFLPDSKWLLRDHAELQPLSQLLERHEGRVGSHTTESREPVIFSSEDFALVRSAHWNVQLDHYIQEGICKPAGEPGIWTVNFAFAWRWAGAALKALKRPGLKAAHKTQTAQSAPIQTPEAANAVLDAEVDAFLFSRKLTSLKKTGGTIGKLLVLLVSIGLFLLWLGVDLSWESILIFFAALLFHESGHLLGMWIFQYTNLQMLFLPFFGAVAIGSRDHAKPWQELIVLLMGPLPGLLLGVALLVAFPYASMPQWMQELTITLFVLNGFNLLPVYPMDGGQIVRLAFLTRFPTVGALFSLASAVILVLLGISGMWGIALLGICMLAATGKNFRMAYLVNAVRKIIRRPEDASEREVAKEVLKRMDDPAFTLDFTRKYLAANPAYIAVRSPRAGIGTVAAVALFYLSPVWVPLAAWPVAQSIADRRLAEVQTKVEAFKLRPSGRREMPDTRESDPAFQPLRKKLSGRAGENVEPLAALAASRFGSPFPGEEEKSDQAVKKGLQDAREAYASELTAPLLEQLMLVADAAAGAKVSMQDWSLLRSGVPILIGTAIVEMEMEKSASAWGRLMAAWRLESVLCSEVIQMTASVVPESSSCAVEWFLSSFPLPSREHIEVLLRQMPSVSETKRERLELLIETRVSLLDDFGGRQRNLGWLGWLQRTPMATFRHAEYLEETIRLVELRADPDKALAETGKEEKDGWISTLFLPVVSPVWVTSQTQAEINRLRLVRGALECYLARLDTGRYPEDLKALDISLQWKERAPTAWTLTILAPPKQAEFSRVVRQNEFRMKPEENT